MSNDHASPAILSNDEAIALPVLLSADRSSLEMCLILAVDIVREAHMWGLMMHAAERGLVEAARGRWRLTPAGRAALAQETATKLTQAEGGGA